MKTECMQVTPKNFFKLSLTVAFLFLMAAVFPHHGFCQAQPEGEWTEALQPRKWTFPRDHSAHPEYQTEWWYFTGNLTDKSGTRFGYQLTFFRFGIRSYASVNKNPWHIRDLFMGHFAITQESEERFRFAEHISREGPGLAGADTERMNVWLFNWSAQMDGSVIFLKAADGPLQLNLELSPLKPLVLHGNKGLSTKGEGTGQASFYTSFTDLETVGSIRVNKNGPAITVQGKSWFDHEFGSNQLSENQQGWDWFSLHLSDGRDVMLYFIRKKGGLLEPASSGTLVESDGTSHHLSIQDISLQVLEEWKSPSSQALYPSKWRILIPSYGVDLKVTPLISNQELMTTASTGIVYWEGAVKGKGDSKDRQVTAEGYVELTGYAGSIGGIF